jgi:hypothetical protein
MWHQCIKMLKKTVQECTQESTHTCCCKWGELSLHTMHDASALPYSSYNYHREECVRFLGLHVWNFKMVATLYDYTNISVADRVNDSLDSIAEPQCITAWIRIQYKCSITIQPVHQNLSDKTKFNNNSHLTQTHLMWGSQNICSQGSQYILQMAWRKHTRVD